MNIVLPVRPTRFLPQLISTLLHAFLVLHRFLYFIDAGDGRGKVLYPRTDGDYGLVEPE